jgi:hypothetical protein
LATLSKVHHRSSNLSFSLLKGKACDIYLSLSAEQTSDYQVVKATILKGYQFGPEAYRQQFRDYKKESDKTFV